MGGQIGIASAVGQGTLVYFTVGQAAPTENLPTPPTAQVQGPKVLLVEDDTDNRALMARFLASQGFQVTEVGRAQEALESLKQNKFDAIVTDISTPGMDGIELVSAWRTLEHQQGHKRTPAIVVTAHSI